MSRCPDSPPSATLPLVPLEGLQGRGLKVAGVWRQQGAALEVRRPGGIWQIAGEASLTENGSLLTGRSLWVPAAQQIPSPERRRRS
jgi:hypothetical protein